MSRPSSKTQSFDTVTRDKSGAVVVRGYPYTLGEISRGSGITRPHITRIFNGQRHLTIWSAKKIASFLGVPMESLVALLEPKA